METEINLQPFGLQGLSCCSNFHIDSYAKLEEVDRNNILFPFIPFSCILRSFPYCYISWCHGEIDEIERMLLLSTHASYIRSSSARPDMPIFNHDTVFGPQTHT